MSEENRRYQKPDIRYHDELRNTEGMTLLDVNLDSIDVVEWHPLPDGKGKSTEVHVSIMLDGLDTPIIMRFKGPGTLDGFISVLAVHRFNVWPDQDCTDAEK